MWKESKGYMSLIRDIEAPDYRDSKEFEAFKNRVESVLTNRPQTVGAILKKIGKEHQAWLADALELIATRHPGYLDKFTRATEPRRFEFKVGFDAGWDAGYRKAAARMDELIAEKLLAGELKKGEKP